MEYIGGTGRQLKIRMKKHEKGSKADFRKKSDRKRKDKLSGLSEHLKKKKHRLDWSWIRFWQKKITIVNADQKKRISLLNTRIKHYF